MPAAGGLGQSGLASLNDQGPLLVHFGNKEFESKFRVLMDNLEQWRASAGRLDSVDLRFSKQVVLNPETKTAASKAPALPVQNLPPPAHSATRQATHKRPASKPAVAKKTR